MALTPHQAQYFAFELTRDRSGRDKDKLTSALLDAQVELTPHQVNAALFAFRSPLSKGVILADEVGLGKTIEAGLVIAQKWAERRRKILVIVPANLRKQWNQELIDKFFLSSLILEAKTAKAEIEKKNYNPFDQKERIVICSYHYARTQTAYIKGIDWDLVVLDEAHKLRNIYRSEFKIGRAIRESIEDKPKILLTATPLQNSLLELYGLASIIDPYIFGDLKSFKLQFARLAGDDARFHDLRQRIASICQRTLRRDVLQYVRYTQRHALTEDFYPGDDEWQLYTWVSEYLQRPTIYALPNQQRNLMILIMRRLLGSSTFAIKGTFEAFSSKLQKILDRHKKDGIFPTGEEMQALDEQQEQAIAETFEDFEDVKEEWAEDSEDLGPELPTFSPQELEQIKKEKEELDKFAALAKSIDKNAKGEHLLSALEKGFKRLKENGAPEKVIIFTESTRTQEYIFGHLKEMPEFKNKIVLFNGSNNDPLSNKIYAEWKRQNEGTDRVTGSTSADKRAALVEQFQKPETKVMIATEAGAEGINLQFCSFIVNYDLPWNPQRIEQRIGRCHRFGQKFDVVVLNFINKRNAADERVVKLLDEKFQIFRGVFGASDEVLGAIESGVDFERRILQIFQQCRNEKEINRAFEELQAELSPQIDQEIKKTRRELLENLDAEVVDKVKIRDAADLDATRAELDKYHQYLWDITRYALEGAAEFNDVEKSFRLLRTPFPSVPEAKVGPYRLLPVPVQSDPAAEQSGITSWFKSLVQKPASTYRAGHPLAQAILKNCKTAKMQPTALHFQYDAHPRITVLEPLLGQSGWLRLEKLNLQFSGEKDEQLLVAAVFDNGDTLDAEASRQLLRLPAQEVSNHERASEYIQSLLDGYIQQQESEEKLQNQDWLQTFFELEMNKIDRWVEDRRQSIRTELRDLESEIKLKKAEARKIIDLQRKINAQRQIKDLDSRLAEKRTHQYEAEKEIEAKKDEFLDDMEARIHQAQNRTELFTVRFYLQKIDRATT